MDCDLCKQPIGFEEKIILEDTRKPHFLPSGTRIYDKIVMCKNCYGKMPKDEKKQYLYERSIPASTWLVGGVAGTLVTDSAIKGILSEKRQKKYGYTLKDLDNFSIDKFNMHWWMLGLTRSKAVRDKFEGKTKSRRYKKFIGDSSSH